MTINLTMILIIIMISIHHLKGFVLDYCVVQLMKNKTKQKGTESVILNFNIIGDTYHPLLFYLSNLKPEFVQSVIPPFIL